jgi:hypothetical protein
VGEPITSSHHRTIAPLHLPILVLRGLLNDADFLRGEVEEAVDAVVEFRLQRDDLPRQPLVLPAALREEGVPVVPLCQGDLPFEALLQLRVEGGEVQLPPGRKPLSQALAGGAEVALDAAGLLVQVIAGALREL